MTDKIAGERAGAKCGIGPGTDYGMPTGYNSREKD
jgi:hypothetical protein